jgi:hypothetical protein
VAAVESVAAYMSALVLRAARPLRASPSFARRLLSTAPEPYDVVVVGGGPGGYPAAIKAGQLGMRVACVEMRGRLGGTCLNVGCIPSKALLHSSHLYEEAAHGWGPHGISADNVKMDLDKLMAHKAKTVTGLTGGIEGLFKKYNVDYYKASGEILSAGSVKATPIDGSAPVTLSTKDIVIATGSEPASLPNVPVRGGGASRMGARAHPRTRAPAHPRTHAPTHPRTRNVATPMHRTRANVAACAHSRCPRPTAAIQPPSRCLGARTCPSRDATSPRTRSTIPARARCACASRADARGARGCERGGVHCSREVLVADR